MKTLTLRDGDFVLGKGGYSMSTGTDRIRQDLTLALTEEYGSDRFHPRFGSVIKQYIGNVITPHLQAMVRAEVNRVVQNYITIQQAEVIRDSQLDVLGRFSTADVVRSLLSIDTTTFMDRINIHLALETLARTTVKIKKQVVS
jgi:phage baseplate assembly protein W